VIVEPAYKLTPALAEHAGPGRPIKGGNRG
jgi:hypothetical protein